MSVSLGGQHRKTGERPEPLIDSMNGDWSTWEISWILAYVEHCPELAAGLHELLDDPVPLIVIRNDDEWPVKPAMVEMQQPLCGTCKHHSRQVVVLENERPLPA